MGGELKISAGGFRGAGKSNDYQRLDVFVDYIFSQIPAFLEKEKGVADYEKFARHVIAFVMERAPEVSGKELSELFGRIAEGVVKRINEKSSDSRSLYSVILHNLFKEIYRQIESDFRLPKADPSITRGVPIPNGSIVNDARVNLWYKIIKSNILNAGLFRSGDPGTAATLYVADRHDILDLERLYLDWLGLKSKIVGGVGLFSIFPNYDFEKRVVLGVYPSLLIFLGLKQELPLGFELREGLQVRGDFYAGYHLPIDILVPVKIGASIGKKFPNKTVVSFGARTLFNLYAKDVQDINSFYPNYDNTLLFLVLRSPYINMRLGYEFYNNEESVIAELYKPFPVFGGILTASLSGRSSIKSYEWVAYRPSFFLGLSYALADKDEEMGFSGSMTVDPTALNNDIGGRYLSFGNDEHDYYNNHMAQTFNELSKYAEVECYHNPSHHGDSGYYTCRPKESYVSMFKCSYGDYIVCEKDGLTFHYKKIADDGDWATFEQDGEVKISDQYPFLNALYESDSFDSFASKLSGMDDYEKLKMINSIARLLYMTYDGQGLVVGNGSGEVNSISYQDMFLRMKDEMFNPGQAKVTTVCRGIAKFVAHLASRWGFESHAVVIQGRGMGHVVAMLRKPGSGYSFIDRGGPIFRSYSVSVLEAALSFAANEGLPPQLRFKIYDSDGKYERIIETNEGKMLKETVIPREEIERYLDLE